MDKPFPAVGQWWMWHASLSKGRKLRIKELFFRRNDTKVVQVSFDSMQMKIDACHLLNDNWEYLREGNDVKDIEEIETQAPARTQDVGYVSPLACRFNAPLDHLVKIRNMTKPMGQCDCLLCHAGKVQDMNQAQAVELAATLENFALYLRTVK